MSFAMSRAEREAFLAATHVAVVAIADGESAPLAVPIWYAYEPGGVIRFVTARSSRKGKLLQKARRVSLCAQTEAPPYKYVSVEGPVAIAKPDYERDVRAVALRYLGPEAGERYLRSLESQDSHREDAEEVLVELTPERWFSVDYTKLGL